MMRIVVGTKIDQKDRKVSYEDANAFAKKLMYSYNEVSSKSGDGINDLFMTLVKQVIKEKYPQLGATTNSTKLKAAEAPAKKQGCIIQ